MHTAANVRLDSPKEIKRPYEKPKVEDLGTVEEVTRQYDVSTGG